MQDENSKWVINCSLSLKFDTEEDASIFYTSFMPEHGTIPRKRTEVALEQSKENIIFTIKAKDVTAFRATINSILQFGNIVFKVIEKVDSLK